MTRVIMILMLLTINAFLTGCPDYRDYYRQQGIPELHILALEYDNKKKAQAVKDARKLLRGGADVNVRDKHGQTALHSAVHWNWRMVAALLEYGADVNARDKDGVTALHMAAEVGNEKAVKALVAGGADVKAKNKKGWTPRDVAKNNTIINLLDGR